MKIQLLIIILCVCTLQKTYSQEEESDGVLTTGIPVRNSLTFNRYIINPTFSFVREEHKYLSVYNKREWTQFENAPVTYLASYSGRFSENIGAGLGLYQQNIGILTTFGGVVNFAYNVPITRYSNLTFGLNLGAYKSGINNSKVISNFDDPSLQNINDNFLITVNPAINYGLEAFDFGLSINNLVTYNFQNSNILEDNPEQSLQLHMLYTGYMYTRGFFDDSKFTGFIKSEFKKEETIISGIAMLTVPKGIWGQIGYNTKYGISAGLGLNITKAIAVEYNYETNPFGDFNQFGASHDVTFTYRIKNYNRYDYSSNDEVSGLITTDKKPKSKSSTTKENQSKLAQQKAQQQAEEQAKLLAEQKAQQDAEAQAKLLAEQKAKQDAEAQAKLLAEKKAQQEAEAQAKLLAEKKAQQEVEAQAKLLAEQKAQQEAEQAKLLAEQNAQQQAEAQAKLLAEQKAKQQAEAQAKLLAEQKAQQEAEAQAKLLAEQKAQQQAEAQAKLLAEQKAQQEAEAQAKLLAEQKAQQEAEAQAKLLADQKAQQEAEAQAILLAEQEANAKRVEEEKAKEELITKPKDKIGKEMLALTQQTEANKISQNKLFEQFTAIIDIKNQDLIDLKEENDLSEQGITVAPKPFKSISAENKTLNQIKADLDNSIENRAQLINELQELYEKNIEADTIYNEEVFLFYRKKLKQLKTEQAEAMALKTNLEVSLKKIRLETNIERKRRIKRAAFDNEDKRYLQDKATLERIKRTTPVTNKLLNPEDFDIGEKPSSNIQILKNVKNVENGFYLIIAIHSEKSKRDEFITKVVSTGDSNINFFFDVSTSKYYIYSKKLNSINEANYAIKNKINKPYNNNMSLVKIEN